MIVQIIIELLNYSEIRLRYYLFSELLGKMVMNFSWNNATTFEYLILNMISPLGIIKVEPFRTKKWGGSCRRYQRK
jgi:hypothetical protein